VTLSAVRVRSTVALVAGLAAAIMLAASPVTAGPVGGPLAADPEGGTAALREQLESASKGYTDAVARLDASKARQVQLAEKARTTEAEYARVTERVGVLAATAYKGGRVGGIAALLDSDSPTGLFEKAMTLNSQAKLDDEQLRRAKETRATLVSQQAAVNDEIKVQQAQLVEMEKRKQAAERALAPVGGSVKANGPTGGSASAKSAPRRADGTFASEGCSVDDPTTSGCITPRLLNALQQAKAAGFTHFVSCFRPQEDGGEHPRGKACDFAAAPNGFGGVATGADKDYGNRLAAYFLANSTNLGVLYVIWFNQIWLPSSGWRAYNGGRDPSSAHTNHVHLSVQ
jgi:peptidoglycan DL-endopeptidase CwlO